ncbi:MAG TPA: DUF6529 family protein [Streptosporangiaceae bacterium]|jgi:hypothetical protein
MTAQPETSAPLPPERAASGAAKLVVPCLIGALVALTLGVFGRLHHPTGIAISIAGFSSVGSVKAWLATIATVFALIQVGSALVMYGKIPRVSAPPWIGGLHRWSGRIAFLVAVPVAVQCLYALGFQTYSARVLTHSILGCLFFGSFTVKMLILPKRDLPSWLLPVLGALVFTALTGVWLTSAYWFFSTFGIKR